MNIQVKQIKRLAKLAKTSDRDAIRCVRVTSEKFIVTNGRILIEEKHNLNGYAPADPYHIPAADAAKLDKDAAGIDYDPKTCAIRTGCVTISSVNMQAADYPDVEKVKPKAAAGSMPEAVYLSNTLKEFAAALPPDVTLKFEIPADQNTPTRITDKDGNFYALLMPARWK